MSSVPPMVITLKPVKAYITPKGILINKSALTEAVWTDIRRDLTLIHNSVVGKKTYTKTLTCFKEIDIEGRAYMLLPRHYEIGRGIVLNHVYKALVAWQRAQSDDRKDVLKKVCWKVFDAAKTAAVDSISAARTTLTASKMLTVAEMSAVRTTIEAAESAARAQIAENIPQLIYEDRRSVGITLLEDSFMNEDGEPEVRLMEDQQMIMDTIAAADESGRSSGKNGRILVMDTGLGKTFCGGQFIASHGGKGLVIVPGLPAAGEWIKMFAKYPRLKAAQYNGKSKKDGDVVVITIDSALRDTIHGRPFHEFFAQFTSIVFDEIHDFPTTTRMEIFWRTCAANTLGLTATPDERADGMGQMLEWFLGPIVRRTDVLAAAGRDLETESIKWKGRVTKVHYKGAPEFTKILTQPVTGWRDYGATIKMLAKDPARNALILTSLRNLYDRGFNTYIFVLNRAHAEHLAKLATEPVVGGQGAGIPADKCALLMGGANPEYKEWALTNCRAIFVTDSYGKQSMSAGHMDALIQGTPFEANITQRLGRILRRNGDIEIERQIIDIIDDELPVKKMFNGRKIAYDAKKFIIV
jgi:superfamily II DNA or RNA helicase